MFAEERNEIIPILRLRETYDDTNLDACVHPSSTREAGECKADPPFNLSPRYFARGRDRELSTSWVGALCVAGPEQDFGWPDLTFVQTVIAFGPGGFPGKHYRTQFRFIDGVYKPIGPPAHGPSIDFAFYRKWYKP